MQTQEIVARLTREGRLSGLAVSDTGFAFDPRTGQSYTVNHTGLAALAGLKQGTPVEEIVDELARAYSVAPELVESSLESFIRQLGRQLV